MVVRGAARAEACLPLVTMVGPGFLSFSRRFLISPFSFNQGFNTFEVGY